MPRNMAQFLVESFIVFINNNRDTVDYYKSLFLGYIFSIYDFLERTVQIFSIVFIIVSISAVIEHDQILIMLLLKCT